MTLPVSIRPLEAQDSPFVMSSFLRSYRDEGGNASLSNEVYYALYKPRANRLVDRSTVLVITPEDDAWQILGWIAFEDVTLHYAYVKSTYRRMGLFDRLYRAAKAPTIITCTGRLIVPLSDRYHFTF